MFSSSRVLLFAFLFAFPLTFVACKTLTEDLAPVAANASADRATFNVVAPILRDLTDEDLSNDPDLTGVTAMALRQMLDTWELRLEQMEAVR